MERKVESKGLGVNGSDMERGNVARHEDGGGSRVWGSNVVKARRLTSCAPLACITLIEWRTNADAVRVGSSQRRVEKGS